MWKYSIGALTLILTVALSYGLRADPGEAIGRFPIVGIVYPPDKEFEIPGNQWQRETTVSIDGGAYKGFLRSDGTFIISAVPSGSYIVEIYNPDYYFESVIVEINRNGKIRARKLENLYPTGILPYPLRIKARGRINYFQTREEWKITNILFSPVVMMAFLPVVLVVILPKLLKIPVPRESTAPVRPTAVKSEVLVLDRDKPTRAEKKKGPMKKKHRRRI